MRTNRVRITVTGGSPVLQIAVALLCHVPGDPDAAAPVGHPGTEVVDAGGLVQTSQPPLVVLPLVGVVRHDVPLVVLGEAVDGGLYDLHPSLLPHGLGGEVTVGPGSVPVSLHRLGVEADDDPEFFCDSGEEVPGQ